MSLLAIDRPTSSTELLRVLVVDDNEPDIDATARLLRKEYGREIIVDSVETGKDALLALATDEFDAVLVDYLLPDMDGLELLSQIQAVHPGIAVVLVSGQGSEAVATRAMKQGAKDYLVKRDINQTTLRRSLSSAVQRTRIDQAAQTQIRILEADRKEMNQCVRSLSHDMSATFMLLEDSLNKLKTAGPTAAHDRNTEMLHVEACLRESKRFLDDLRTLAKSGTVSYECSRVDLNRVVHDVVYELTDWFAKRNIQVTVAQKLPAVWCHAGRASQIVSNLLRNAVLHGCDSIAPQITVDTVRRNDLDPGLAWLRIADNGPGIPREKWDAVFQPGVRLHPDKAAGTGMGLAIVQDLVGHMNGHVQIDPQADSGLAILVGLPKRAK